MLFGQRRRVAYPPGIIQAHRKDVGIALREGRAQARKAGCIDQKEVRLHLIRHVTRTAAIIEARSDLDCPSLSREMRRSHLHQVVFSHVRSRPKSIG